MIRLTRKTVYRTGLSHSEPVAVAKKYGFHVLDKNTNKNTKYDINQQLQHELVHLHHDYQQKNIEN